MAISDNWPRRAREVSGLRPEACAAAMGRSRGTYDDRERRPGRLTLDEVRMLSRAYTDPESVRIMVMALADCAGADIEPGAVHVRQR